MKPARTISDRRSGSTSTSDQRSGSRSTTDLGTCSVSTTCTAVMPVRINANDTVSAAARARPLPSRNGTSDPPSTRRA